MENMESLLETLDIQIGGVNDFLYSPTTTTDSLKTWRTGLQNSLDTLRQLLKQRNEMEKGGQREQIRLQLMFPRPIIGRVQETINKMREYIGVIDERITQLGDGKREETNGNTDDGGKGERPTKV